MNVLLDGLTILIDNWLSVAGIIAFMLAGQSLFILTLRSIFEGNLSTGEYLSLGVAGWILPALLISIIWMLSGVRITAWIGISLLVVLLFITISRLKSDLKSASTSTSLFLLVIVFVIILLRLAYVSKTIFPLYFDSAQHYALTKSILENDWMWLSVTYYHLGFHFLTAFLASILNIEITRVMLILGQMILVFVPFSLFFLVRQATKSNMAGGFAVILSAFGWYMPAHAVDWGKYPALMSLGLIPFVLSMAYLVSQQKNGFSVKKRLILYGFLGVSAILAVFTHSRSLIALGIILLAWVAVTWLEKLPRRVIFLAFVLVVGVMFALSAFILRQDILILLFDPYLAKGILVSALVLLLAVFAWMAYPRLTFVSVLSVTLLIASLFIPVTFLPGYRDLTLLDRPYVEMILFLPLTMLGGLGLAGLEKRLQERFSWSRYVGLFAIGIVAVNAFFTYDLYPSDCCVIVGNDDVVAMDWMANQLPVDARIGISSTELKVLISESPEGDVGADAGIWIMPLTGRVTFPLPYDSEFDQHSALERLCDLEIGYLFVGEMGQPFDVGKIISRPEWYRPLLSMPKTRVYRVVGCN